MTSLRILTLTLCLYTSFMHSMDYIEARIIFFEKGAPCANAISCTSFGYAGQFLIDGYRNTHRENARKRIGTILKGLGASALGVSFSYLEDLYKAELSAHQYCYANNIVECDFVDSTFPFPWRKPCFLVGFGLLMIGDKLHDDLQ